MKRWFKSTQRRQPYTRRVAVHLPTCDHKQARIKYAHLKKDLQTIEKEYLGLLPANLKAEYDELLERQHVLKANQGFLAAARMVRLFTPAYLKLRKNFEAAISESYRVDGPYRPKAPTAFWFNDAPLVVPHKESGKVIVFPYLILNRTTRQDLENLCYLLCFDTLGTFLDVMHSKPRNWQPFSRAWQKIRKQEIMTVERYFIKYTGMLKDGVHPAMIQRFAATFIELDKPLELNWVDQPADWLKMFGVGTQSCMTLTDEKAEQWKDLVAKGYHPASLFAAHPYVAGIYVAKAGRVIGRCYMYMKSDKEWYYGRVYASDGRSRDTLINSLQQAGYKAISGSFNRKVTYQIKGIKNRKHSDWMLPVPYTEGIDNHVHVHFNQKDKMWTVEFGCQSSSANLQMSSTQGYILAKNYSSIPCQTCSKDIKKGQYLSPPGDITLYYCSVSCAEKMGWVQATQKDGVTRLVRREYAYQDWFISSAPASPEPLLGRWYPEYYTTRAAIKAHGATRVCHDIEWRAGRLRNVELSPEEYSRIKSPYTAYITWRNNNYVIERTKYDKLLKAGRIVDGEVLTQRSASG